MDVEILYMSDYCRPGEPTQKKWRRIELQTTGRHSAVKLRSHRKEFSSSQCKSRLRVTSPKGSRLTMSIEDLDTETDPKENYCYDYVDVLKLDSLVSRFCGLLEETAPTTYVSQDNDLYFKWNFFTGNTQRRGFSVVLTAFTEPANGVNCTSDSPGQDSLFLCDNGRCIDNRWRCDDRNNCGDASDEKGCRGTDQYKVILAICTCVAVVIVAATVAIAMCLKLRHSPRRGATVGRRAPVFIVPVGQQSSKSSAIQS